MESTLNKINQFEGLFKKRNRWNPNKWIRYQDVKTLTEFEQEFWNTGNQLGLNQDPAEYLLSEIDRMKLSKLQNNRLDTFIQDETGPFPSREQLEATRLALPNFYSILNQEKFVDNKYSNGNNSQ